MNVDDETRRVIARALDIACRRWAPVCGTEHLLLALICEVRHVRQVARQLGIAGPLFDAADHQPKQLPPSSPPVSPRAKQVMAQAERDAALRAEPMNVVDLSWALLGSNVSGAASWLADCKIEIADFRDMVHGSTHQR